MGNRMGRVGLLLFLVWAGTPPVWGYDFLEKAPSFTQPAGTVAFMGCYWSPLTIVGNGAPSTGQPAVPPAPGTNQTIASSGNVKVGVNSSGLGQMLGGAIVGDVNPPAPEEATQFADQAVLDKGAQAGMSLSPAAYSAAYQNALLMHILNPAKWAYNPALTRYCGNAPYILIGLIDYAGEYPSSAKIREKDNDRKIDYWGKRSILEQDSDIFSNQGTQHAVALEFFLVSTADGRTLWQGNLMTTGNKGSSYKGITEGLVEKALKNLMGK